MSIENLYNAKFRISRLEITKVDDKPVRGKYGSKKVTKTEIKENPVLDAQEFDCRLEKLYDRELIQSIYGSYSKGTYVMYCSTDIPLKDEDLIEMTVTPKDFILDNLTKKYLTVHDIDNAGGGHNHHFEVYLKLKEGIN